MNSDARFVMIAPIPAIAIITLLFLPRHWSPVPAAGLLLMVAGLALVTLARWQLGNAFSIAPRATTLVTRGLYARIRNPVYLFGIVMLAGLFLYLRRPWLLAVLLPIVTVQVVRSRREAKVLEAKFGDAYREYRARTWF
jgi:protein-S-isoprenylcysteine O-methyltransferase Ste14